MGFTVLIVVIPKGCNLKFYILFPLPVLGQDLIYSQKHVHYIV